MTMRQGVDTLRYFITTDGAWFSPQVASRIQQNVSTNIRRFWTNYAFDFTGFNIKSIAIDGEPGIRLREVIDRMNGDGKLSSDDVLDLTRILVSEHSIQDDIDLSETKMPALLVTMSPGQDDRWGPGSSGVHADISVRSTGERVRIESAISDIFHDIMIANGSMVELLKNRFTSTTKSIDQFFEMKVDYAKKHIKAFGAPIMFPNYAPKKYASFASLSRNGVIPGPLGINLEMLSYHWDQFANQYLKEFFLSPEDAADFVFKSSFRRSSIGRRDKTGQNISKKARFGYLSVEDLVKTFGDRQTVNKPGSYILIVLTRTPTVGQIKKLGSLMGWSSMKDKKIKIMKLVRPLDYAEFKEFVADGTLTPIRLFLKPRGT